MSKYVWVLRTSDKHRRSYNGFQWPEKGMVEAQDWDPVWECGNGLHGALWGEGDGSLFNWNVDATWQIVKVLRSDIGCLDGKVKFPRGEVIFSGSRKEATNKMYRKRPGAIIGGTATVGTYGTATAGYWGIATAGYRGTATAGYRGTATAGARGIATVGTYGTATAGNEGTATAGYGGTATVGTYGIATAGNEGTATAGYGGTATAGYGGAATAGNEGTATVGTYGTATAGNEGTATAGYLGTATAGNEGTATAGYGGTATAGQGGELRIRWKDGSRYKLAVGYVGEDGIRANVAYICNKHGRLVVKGDE